jgi:hypothetical protein
VSDELSTTDFVETVIIAISQTLIPTKPIIFSASVLEVLSVNASAPKWHIVSNLIHSARLAFHTVRFEDSDFPQSTKRLRSSAFSLSIQSGRPIDPRSPAGSIPPSSERERSPQNEGNDGESAVWETQSTMNSEVAQGHEGERGSIGGNGMLIGVIAALAILVVIVCVIILFWRRSQSKENPGELAYDIETEFQEELPEEMDFDHETPVPSDSIFEGPSSTGPEFFEPDDNEAVFMF